MSVDSDLGGPVTTVDQAVARLEQLGERARALPASAAAAAQAATQDAQREFAEVRDRAQAGRQRRGDPRPPGRGGQPVEMHLYDGDEQPASPPAGSASAPAPHPEPAPSPARRAGRRGRGRPADDEDLSNESWLR